MKDVANLKEVVIAGRRNYSKSRDNSWEHSAEYFFSYYILFVASYGACDLFGSRGYPTGPAAALVLNQTQRKMAGVLPAGAVAALTFLSIRIDGNLFAPKAYRAHRRGIVTVTRANPSCCPAITAGNHFFCHFNLYHPFIYSPTIFHYCIFAQFTHAVNSYKVRICIVLMNYRYEKLMLYTHWTWSVQGHCRGLTPDGIQDLYTCYEHNRYESCYERNYQKQCAGTNKQGHFK